MKLLCGQLVAENDFIVIGYYEETEGLPQEIINEGILVESVAIPQSVPGKMAVHHINTGTGEQWFEYKDIPLNPEDRLTQLEQIVADIASLQLGV